MSKAVDAIKTKLLWKLLGCIVIAGCIAGACAYAVSQFGAYYVETTFDKQEVNRSFQLRYMEDLQNYVDENKITSTNISALEDWANENTYVYFSVYQNNLMIFNSDYVFTEAQEFQTDDEEDESDNESLMLNSNHLYQLNLTDGVIAGVDMFCYDYWSYNTYVLIISIALGIILFIIIFTNLISRKLTYIHQLEYELQILEGGNLEFPISIKGNDELGSLARGIDEMRLSIIDNMQKEQKLLQANKNLVTAMSHDLRTPLTTLTGYLELLTMGRETDDEKKRRYLKLSLDKTHEIKELSDELFEYFLAFGEERRSIEVEPFSSYELVMDLVENQFLGLEENGYRISVIEMIDENAGNCLINPGYMRRVLNNILSNLSKYAEETEPVEISASVTDKYLTIVVKNRIKINMEPHESTNIGLITCDRIMKLHNGGFFYEDDETYFVVKLLIPME